MAEDMKRILWLSEFPPEKGAIADYSKHLTKGLADSHGYEIDILTESGEKPEAPVSGVTVRGEIPRSYNGWAKVLDRDYDGIQIQFPVGRLRYLVARKWLSRDVPPTLITIHDVPGFQQYSLLFGSFRNLIFLTESTRQEHIAAYPLTERLRARNYFTVPYLGIEKSIQDRITKKHLGIELDDEATNVVCPGFVHEKKGFHKVVDALPQLKKKYPDIHITISGGEHRGHSGDYMSELENSIKQQGLSDNVTITGVLPTEDHVNEYIRQADCVVLPFDEITQSASLAKTLALGSVPVTTPLPSLSPLIENYGGVVMEANTINALVDAVETAINSPPTINSTGILEDLCWEQNVAAYADIYSRVFK
jgi:glycosyltransferase involved in cell wall biosynthesis